MRPRFLVVLCAAAVGGCNPPPPARPGKKAELDAMITRSDAMQRAEGSLNPDSAAAFWGDQAILQHPGAPTIEGRDAVRSFYSGMFATKGLKKFDVSPTRYELSQSLDFAWEYGVTRTTTVGPKGDAVEAGKYLKVWKKVNGTWLVVAESESNDAPAK